MADPSPLGPKEVAALRKDSPDALPTPAHPTAVLVMSDKKAKNDAASWGAALNEALAGRPVQVVPVVNAAHLPGPLIPFVSVYLQAVGATDAMVDKKGWTEKEEGYTPGRVLLLVVGKGGDGEPVVLWRRTVREVDGGVLDDLVDATSQE